MDLGRKLLLISSLGQIKQLRVWLPNQEFHHPTDIDFKLIRTSEQVTLQIIGLEIDLYGKLTRLITYLNENSILEHPEIAFDVDLESNEDGEDFSVMLNSEGDVILLYSSKTDIKKMQDWLMIEWTKILTKVNQD